MRWILMVQDLLPTALAKINRKVEADIKQWWGLPRSASRDAIREAIGTPSMADLAEQGQLIKHHIAQYSKDRNVRAAWASRKARNYKPIRKLTATFGAILPESRVAAKRTLAHHQSQHLHSTVAKLKVQGQWSKLELSEEQQKRWRGMIWGLPASVTQFATKAAIDLLPTRANLARWKVAMDSGCPRCGVKETLHHVLNNCSVLLTSGAYKWRHDSVLQQLHADILGSNQWDSVCVDLPGCPYALPFAPDASWRPDLVLLAGKHRIHFVELTIPFEANMPAAHLRKEQKYQQLMGNARDAGLIPVLECIEMGSRGVPSKAWGAFAKTHKIRPSTTKACSEIALRASMVVWGNRYSPWPDPPLLPQKTTEW